MDDLLSEFLTETAENLAVLDVELVRLEQTPDDPALLGNIFRLVHTIKGTCGFLGLPRLEAVAHAGENVLGRIRDGALTVTPDTVTLVLTCLDTIKEILDELAASGAEPAGDDSDLLAMLAACASGEPMPAAQPEPDFGEVAPDDPEIDFTPVPAKGAVFESPKPTARPVPAPAAAPPPPHRPAATRELAPPHPPLADDHHEAHEPLGAAPSVRVNVDLLDSLMTMVSELVLTRNQVMQILRHERDSVFAEPLQRLNHITSELQERVMKTRMQPIGNAWTKLPRLIRDLGHELGKVIALEMTGEDTELDRQVLELIRDPLTHMVRNAADHGIEPPHERRAAGKSEVGRVRLRASQEGGHIIIQISDDGRGLSLAAIRAKALALGLAGEADLAAMSEQQVLQFVFQPGFSTSREVSTVSGRGVGMDVVRTNIEKIGGTVEMATTNGRGSTFTLKIPLTLAIANALIVDCAGERFAIPQINVVELVRTGGPVGHPVDRINDIPVLRLRDRLLPLVSLRRLLHLDGSDDDAASQLVVITQVGTYIYGLLVDQVFDTEEIVVKPVAPILRDIDVYSGNTILGDGSVVLILDPNGIAATTGDLSVVETVRSPADADGIAIDDGDSAALLLFRAGTRTPKAVPLVLVARLEEIAESTIEVTNGRYVVQYHDRLMPLISLDPSFVPGSEAGEDRRRPVVVFADGAHAMGLIVDDIVDIVEEPVHVEPTGSGPGILGSAIICGRTTEVIDAGYFLTQANPDWFHADGEAQAALPRERVLLVDDSAFFRSMLTPILAVSGFTVTAVDDPAKALRLCQQGEQFDVIISDIEMPGMDGFEFAAALRNRDCPWRHLPVIALSSHATPTDLDRGRRAGFTDYVAKSDRHALQAALAEFRGAA
ncbi:MAG: chemotaxis protein CheW [Rhodospirillaceae bacterium]|nr:chemotaxis protein CheW [Rhodospirillaceae bacterium]